MKSNKTKYIFECTAPSELTEFNKKWNKDLEDYCERQPKFKPTLQCQHREFIYGPCKYLKIKKY